MEEKMRDKYLPIGSVVLLKGGTKKAMITGFCSVSAEDKTKIYDYTGCVYPEGYLDFNEVCLFDHSQIETIYHLGFINDEEETFKKELEEMVENFKDGEKISKIFEEGLMEEENSDDDEETNDELPIPKMDVENNDIEELEYLEN